MPWVNRRPPPYLATHDRKLKSPHPVGPLSGKRGPLRRAFARSVALIDRTVERLPGGSWLHRQVRKQLVFTDVDVALHTGAPGLDGCTIAYLSDIHAGMFMDAADLAAIFARVAAAKPDVVCFGGDLINTREREILLYRQPLQLLRPPLGVYAVPGNHEHFFGRDVELQTDFLQSHGVRVLDNCGVRLERNGASLWLCGVDDLTEGKPDLGAALAGRRPGEPAVLLSHHPDLFIESAVADVDLTLSGHTHGGQFLLFGWTPLHHTAFGWWRGLYRELDSWLYVGRGVGATLFPLRHGATPEIPLLHLRAPVAPLPE